MEDRPRCADPPIDRAAGRRQRDQGDRVGAQAEQRKSGSAGSRCSPILSDVGCTMLSRTNSTTYRGPFMKRRNAALLLQVAPNDPRDDDEDDRRTSTA